MAFHTHTTRQLPVAPLRPTALSPLARALCRVIGCPTARVVVIGHNSKNRREVKLRHLTLIFAALFGLTFIQLAAAQEKENIAWGGSNPGGVMYYMVGTAGTIISEKLPQYNITQVTTGGSTENAKRIIKGELDMGIVYGAHVYMSQKPEGPFEGGAKGTMFRGIAKAYKGPTYFVTLPGSGINSISDLAGKKVALGPPGSGTVFNCSNIMRSNPA
jgi:TRAP transporter TAXI family solute receptor